MLPIFPPGHWTRERNRNASMCSCSNFAIVLLKGTQCGSSGGGGGGFCGVYNNHHYHLLIEIKLKKI